MVKQLGTNDSKKSVKDLSLEKLFEMFPNGEFAMRWFEANIWTNDRI